MSVPRCVAVLALCPLFARGLDLKVLIHYPEKDSAVEHCGFKFHAATTIGDPEKDAVNARRVGSNLFQADMQLDDNYLYTSVLVGVLASDSNVGNPKCQTICPRVGPQGDQLQYGPFLRIEELGPSNAVELWPSFCAFNWSTQPATFTSHAIGGKQVNIKARVPAAVLENPLPRPSALIPPIMFRFNSEWYWWTPEKQYTTIHDLMQAGEMENFVVAEVYIEGNDWNAWDTQPIYTTETLTKSCTCESELQFICDAWNAHGHAGYEGGNHSFDSAPAFFDELYELALPQVLEGLPKRTDELGLRVGAWGYCIGGLAAWNAVSTRPWRFNIGYLGSPAMDFNCGHAFSAVSALANATTPSTKIYIDSGAGEGMLMNRQSLLLFHKLKAEGFVAGRDVFYERAAFGTHQGRALLRRSLRGLLALFGTGGTGAAPAALLSSVGTGAAEAALATAPLSQESKPLSAWYLAGASLVGAVTCFVFGRLSASSFRWDKSARSLAGKHEPLLA